MTTVFHTEVHRVRAKVCFSLEKLLKTKEKKRFKKKANDGKKNDGLVMSRGQDLRGQILMRLVL